MERALPVLLALLVAGCLGSGPTPDPTPTEPAEVPVFPFDGQGALAYVEGLVTDDDGAPRYRVPGQPGHSDAAAWLAFAMTMDGWVPGHQSFNWSDYLALDHDPVRQWGPNSGFCRQEDRDRLADVVFHNLIATWDGPADGPHLILAAHWDSKENAGPTAYDEPVLGANDGASGVGVLLRLMQHVAQGELTPLAGLTVVFVDGEDGFEDCHPLAGSLYHAQSLAAANRTGDFDAMILLDMVGDPDARFPRETSSVRTAPALVDLLWHHGHRAGLGDNLLDEERGVFDDHLSYIREGIPAVDIIDYGRPDGDGQEGFPPYWHSPGDTLDNIDADMLGRVGAMLATTLSDPQLAAAV